MVSQVTRPGPAYSKKAELTLKDTLDIYRTDETTTSQMKQITAAARQAIEPTDKDVAVVKHTTARSCQSTTIIRTIQGQAVWLLWKLTPFPTRMPGLWSHLPQMWSPKPLRQGLSVKNASYPTTSART